MGISKPILEMTLEEYHKIMSVNGKSLTYTFSLLPLTASS